MKMYANIRIDSRIRFPFVLLPFFFLASCGPSKIEVDVFRPFSVSNCDGPCGSVSAATRAFVASHEALVKDSVLRGAIVGYAVSSSFPGLQKFVDRGPDTSEPTQYLIALQASTNDRQEVVDAIVLDAEETSRKVLELHDLWRVEIGNMRFMLNEGDKNFKNGIIDKVKYLEILSDITIDLLKMEELIRIFGLNATFIFDDYYFSIKNDSVGAPPQFARRVASQRLRAFSRIRRLQGLLFEIFSDFGIDAKAARLARPLPCPGVGCPALYTN